MYFVGLDSNHQSLSSFEKRFVKDMHVQLTFILLHIEIVLADTRSTSLWLVELG